MVQRALLGLCGAFWFSLELLSITGVVDFGLSAGATVLGVLMLGNGGALLLAARFSLTGRKLIDYATIALAGTNAVLSITDEVGLMDIVSLIVCGAVIVLVALNLRSTD